MNQKELIRQFREDFPASEQMGVVFGDCKIAVRANHKAIITSLEEYYQPFLADPENADIRITVHEAPVPEIQTADSPVSFTIKQPDPGKTKIKEEYADIPGGRIVRKRLTGMVFVFGDAEHLGIGPCLENINQVVNFINNRYIQWKLCRGCLLGHAAGIIWKGKGMALAGFSGAGKSTLALHLMSRGATFVSNDRLMIEKNGNGLVMHGVAKLPRINPGTILNNEHLIGIMTPEDRERFSALSKEELWNLEHKYDAPIDQCFGPGRFVLSAPMHTLGIINWNSEKGDTSVQPVDIVKRDDLLPAFMKSTGLFFLAHEICAMPEPCPENYTDHLSLGAVLEITGETDFDKAADMCISFLYRI